MSRTHLVGICGFLLQAGVGSASAQHVLLDLRTAVPSFHVEQFQPQIQWSGRINSIAVNPAIWHHVTVGSETGGLFQTENGGLDWRHLDGMPAYNIKAVAYHPADPAILIATTGADFKTVNGAGIWRSADGGETWAQAEILTLPTPGYCTGAIEAGGISLEPSTGDIYVATNCGMAISRDRGASWVRYRVPGSPAKVFLSVQALGGGKVVGAGRAGVFYSLTAGTTWVAARGPTRIVSGPNTLARSANFPSGVYLLDDRYVARFSGDGGVTWIAVTRPLTPAAGSGGIPFVKVSDDGPRDRLHIGNKRDLYSGRVGGSFALAVSDHYDTRDLGFVSNQMRYLATDGGFHVPSGPNASWVSIGSGRHGLNALQLYEVSGQRIVTPRRHDLYFGTQDNNLWSSGDGGRTWPYSVRWEGFYIDPLRAVREEADAFLLFTSCGSCWTNMSGAHFDGVTNFPDATAMAHEDESKGYALIGEGMVVQAGRETEDDPDAVYFTDTLGDDWRRIQEVPEEILSVPQVSSRPDPIVYIAVRTTTGGGARNGLLRLSGIREATHSLLYPAMNGHNGLGQIRFPAGFAPQAVFAVDPSDPMHLIAPDPGDEEVKETWDGGESWTAIEGLREMVTHGATLRSAGGESLVSAISFHPQNATVVLMGSREGGLYFSHDRGRTWEPVPGSEPVRFVSSIYWKGLNEAYVSTYGRGLWRLRITYRAPLTAFKGACGSPCLLADIDQPVPRPFTGNLDFQAAALFYDGRALDAGAEDGVLRKVALTPASAWMTLVAPGHTLDPAVGETSQPGAFEGLKAARDLMQAGWTIKGFTIAGGKVKDVVISLAEATVAGPGKVVPYVDTGAPESGVLQRPYLRASYQLKQGRLTVTGERFHPGIPLKVTVDGDTPKQAVKPRADGSFTLKLKPRLDPGNYEVRAVQRVGNLTLTDTTLLSIGTNDGVEAP